MNSQWQTYQVLELIPEVPAPQVQHSILVRHLSWGWRSLLNRFDQGLSYWQQIERLEHCYEAEVKPASNSWWHSLWHVLNQPLFTWRHVPALEPKIWQSADFDGSISWHIYDPVTGRAAILASESEVQIWLDKHIYY
jgi:hypothetical protein